MFEGTCYNLQHMFQVNVVAHYEEGCDSFEDEKLSNRRGLNDLHMIKLAFKDLIRKQNVFLNFKMHISKFKMVRCRLELSWFIHSLFDYPFWHAYVQDNEDIPTLNEVSDCKVRVCYRCEIHVSRLSCCHMSLHLDEEDLLLEQNIVSRRISLEDSVNASPHAQWIFAYPTNTHTDKCVQTNKHNYIHCNSQSYTFYP